MLMTGCSRLPSVTLDQLKEEVNAAHQAVDNDGLSKQFILRQPVDKDGTPISAQTYYVDSSAQPYDPDLVLARQQMEEDVAYLFDALYACYGELRPDGRADCFRQSRTGCSERVCQVSFPSTEV